MSKRILASGADTKTNQQTSSKVDVNLTINNIPRRDTAKTQTITRTFTDDQTDSLDINVFEGVETHDPSESEPTSEEAFKQKVNLKVKPSQIRGKTVVRYATTQTTPTITAEELENNIDFQIRIRQILTEIITQEDRKLLSNLIDQTKKTIVSIEQLKEIFALALSSSSAEFYVTPDDIVITAQGNVDVGCTVCKKVIKIQPVQSIKLSTEGKLQDMQYTQRELFDSLASEYGISTSRVYIN